MSDDRKRGEEDLTKAPTPGTRRADGEPEKEHDTGEGPTPETRETERRSTMSTGGRVAIVGSPSTSFGGRHDGVGPAPPADHARAAGVRVPADPVGAAAGGAAGLEPRAAVVRTRGNRETVTRIRHPQEPA